MSHNSSLAVAGAPTVVQYINDQSAFATGSFAGIPPYFVDSGLPSNGCALSEDTAETAGNRYSGYTYAFGLGTSVESNYDFNSPLNGAYLEVGPNRTIDGVPNEQNDLSYFNLADCVPEIEPPPWQY
jgi:hypothetical protein